MKFLTRYTPIFFLFTTLQCAKSTGTLKPIDDGIITIGIYSDEGAAAACVIAAENMFSWMGYTITSLEAYAINNEDIRHIDVFYFPGGSSRPYCEDITEAGKDKIRQLVNNGCGYIGTCAGAMFAARTQIWQDTAFSQAQLDIFPGIAKGPIPEIFGYRGIGMCQVNLHKPHPITNSEPDSVWILYYDGPYFAPDPGSIVEIIGTYEITGQPALVACQYGEGRVFLTGPHPEWEEDSDRDSVSYFDHFDDHGSDWELMMNATSWVLQETN